MYAFCKGGAIYLSTDQKLLDRDVKRRKGWQKWGSRAAAVGEQAVPHSGDWMDIGTTYVGAK